MAEEVKETEVRETTDPGDMTTDDLDKALETGSHDTQTTEVVPETTAETKKETTPEVKTEEKPISEEERLRKQVTDKQAFIDRQAQEIGERRKREQTLSEEIQAHKEALKTIWATDPLGSLELTKEITAKETELQSNRVQTYIDINKQAVAAHVSNLDTFLPDIQKMLIEEDKLPKETVDRFIANPYAESTGTLVALAKRAETRKILTVKDAEIARLTAEVETLRGKPDEVVRKIEAAARQSQPITAKTGRSTSEKGPIDESQIADMSDEELEEAMKETG